MLAKEQIADLDRMAKETSAAFAAACRDQNITKEDYDKLRRQYDDAMRRSHAAHGY